VHPVGSYYANILRYRVHKTLKIKERYPVDNEDKSTVIFRNVGNYLLVNKAYSNRV